VRNQAALIIKISVRFNLQRKVHSWDRVRKCTICDSVTVRSARRHAAKSKRLPRSSLITLVRGGLREITVLRKSPDMSRFSDQDSSMQALTFDENRP
jgi:hypothetical protein